MNNLLKVKRSLIAWIRRRCAASVLVFPLIIGLLLAVLGIVRQQEINKAYLEIAFESDATGVTQVFWDIGRGFNQEDSVASSIRHASEEKEVRFRLPEETIRQIRFDPNNRPCTFTLHRFRIVDGAGRQIIPTTMNPASGIGVATEEDGAVTYALTNQDPIFLINVDPQMLNQTMATMLASRSWPWSLLIVVLAVVGAYGGYFLLGEWSVPLILAYINWRIFAPGVFSPDSLDQYQQALNHRYSNWHPAAMAIALHYLLGIGLSLSQVIFIQILSGFAGLYFLIRRLIEVFSRFKGESIGRAYARYGALIGLLIIVSPLTPFAAFISTFWKDVWFAIFLIWIVTISLTVFEKNTATGGWLGNIAAMFGLIVLMVFSVLVRYNAILLIPAYAIILFLIARRLPVWLRIAGVGALILGCLFFNSFLIWAYRVTKLEPKLSVMSLEMVGLAVLYPELLDGLPYTRSQLKEGYRERFTWAAYRELRWNDNSIVYEDFVKPVNNPKLKEEYFYSVRHHPVRMAQVKIMNFIQLLDPGKTAEWCPRGIPDNEYGFKPNFLFSYARGKYFRLAFATLGQPILRWISTVNLVWLIFSLVLLIRWGWRWLRYRNTDTLFMMTLAALAPLYYFSYLLASPWRAFRYMYPATLLTQIIGIAILAIGLSVAVSRIRRWQGDRSYWHVDDR